MLTCGRTTLHEAALAILDRVPSERVQRLIYKRKQEELQAFARSMGLGTQTGIDLPGEVSGRIPDAAWKEEFNRDYPEYQMWLPGDTVNMAIGQGDLLVSPLQLAAAYGGIANGGAVMKPHVLDEVRDGQGDAVHVVEPEVAYQVDVSEANLGVMERGLRGVITDGTAKTAFRGLDLEVVGKTGTAEVAGSDDYAWFVGYAPADDPQYVVAVVIEEGGHGGTVAAPAVREILSALFGLPVEHVTGSDDSR
jgi:penicillin-binding protein 2